MKKRKNVYGVLKISEHSPESEEKMFTLRGHHLDTVHGEEQPERGPVKSAFTVSLISCGSDSWAQVVFQWIVDPGNFKKILAFVFRQGSLNACLCGWTFSFAVLLSVFSDVEINRNIGSVGSLWSNERTYNNQWNKSCTYSLTLFIAELLPTKFLQGAVLLQFSLRIPNFYFHILTNSLKYIHLANTVICSSRDTWLWIRSGICYFLFKCLPNLLLNLVSFLFMVFINICWSQINLSLPSSS